MNKGMSIQTLKCKDKIWSEHTRRIRVVQASKKTTERRLNWYGHVMRRDEEHILRQVLRMDTPGKRKIGRPKQDGKTRANAT